MRIRVAVFCIRSQYEDVDNLISSLTSPEGIFAREGTAVLAHDHKLWACRPIDEVTGAAAAERALLDPLFRALPDCEVRVDIAMHGNFKGGEWTASSGHLCGIFAHDLFGIPATRRAIWLRFGCFQRWEDGSVAETLVILDLPSLMIQARVWPLADPLGPDFMAPGPRGGGGIWPAGDGAASLSLVESMIAGLKRFDGSLKTMNMRDFFAENFWWFGPGPIGTFRGFADYERGHAKPFLRAFPDRVGGNHRARFGQGQFVASTGWPSITATHLGGDWLGVSASQKPVTMRVMDFWRADAGMLVENWVMIDIPELLNQIGIDVFAAITERK